MTRRWVWPAVVAVGVGVVIAAVLIAAWPWLVRVGPGLGRLAAAYGLPVLLGAAGLTVVVVGWRRIQAGRVRRRAVARRSWRALPGWVVPIGAVAVGLVAWWATDWLLADVVLPAGSNPVEAANLRVDAIRTGLSVGAGAAGALALLLAVRRQWLAEQTQTATEYDAGEKRITELYVKAADQLGSDKAAVRLAGLYALERLAQDNADHRQTIVEVICAYLRMPYTPPVEDPADGKPSIPRRTGRQYGAVLRPSRRSEPEPTTSPDTDSHEEREVRLTAQRILTRHLRPYLPDTPAQSRRRADSRFWDDTSIDLTGATLIDWDITDCRVRQATFTKATFTGVAGFGGAAFTGDAGFGGAAFTGVARFGGAAFSGVVGFDEAAFTGDVGFGGATFTGDAGFDEATFTGDAWFGGAAFTGDAGFGGAAFTGVARFGGAAFTGDAWFDGAAFTGDARFDEAAFTGDAGFDEATFTGDAWFGGATFTGVARFDGATFSSVARFDGAAFTGGTTFAAVTASATGDHLWPAGWRLDIPTDSATGRLVINKTAVNETAVPILEPTATAASNSEPADVP